MSVAVLGVSADTTPTEIKTAEDLANIVNDLGGSYILANDITITRPVSFVAETGKVDESKIFSGVLDGNGKTITLDMTDTDWRNGVFAQAGGENCVIKNLTVNGSVTSKGNSCGGVVGTAKGQITFDNVKSNVNIKSTSDSDGSSGTGGILGVNEGQLVTFQNCVSNAVLEGKRGVGGFLGLVRNGGCKHVFENCVFNGSVMNVSPWSDKRGAGGYIGIMHLSTNDEVDVKFTNCQSNGKVESLSVLASAWVGSHATFKGNYPTYTDCSQTAKVYMSGIEISSVCETKYPEAHDVQCSGSFEFDAENQTVTGKTYFAMNSEAASAYAAAENTRVYVNGVLDSTAKITADARRLTVVCSDPTVTKGTRTSILIVFGDGHYSTLSQNHEVGADAIVTFTRNGANANSIDPTINLPHADYITTDKDVYIEGEPIMVTPVGSGKDRVGIWKEGDKNARAWQYIDSANGGKGSGVALDIVKDRNESKVPDLSAGEYIVGIIPNGQSLKDSVPVATKVITILPKDWDKTLDGKYDVKDGNETVATVEYSKDAGTIVIDGKTYKVCGTLATNGYITIIDEQNLQVGLITVSEATGGMVFTYNKVNYELVEHTEEPTPSEGLVVGNNTVNVPATSDGITVSFTAPADGKYTFSWASGETNGYMAIEFGNISEMELPCVLELKKGDVVKVTVASNDMSADAIDFVITHEGSTVKPPVTGDMSMLMALAGILSLGVAAVALKRRQSVR